MTASPPDDRDAAELRAFLAERDVACPGCGYNLRGLQGDSCPECGTRPRLGVVGMPRGLMLVGIPIAALGTLAVCSIGGLVYTVPRLANPVDGIALAFYVTLLGSSAVGLIRAAVIRSRRVELAWWWAGVSLLLVAVWLLAFTARQLAS